MLVNRDVDPVITGEVEETRAAGSSAPACSRNGQCPAKTTRTIMFCSASLKGVCKYGFNAIDHKGQCYRKRSANDQAKRRVPASAPAPGSAIDPRVQNFATGVPLCLVKHPRWSGLECLRDRGHEDDHANCRDRWPNDTALRRIRPQQPIVGQVVEGDSP